jgi:uncharacterized protein
MKHKLLCIFVLLALFSCKKKKDEPEPATPYDKRALLVNLADNVILPDYNSFKSALDSLTISFSAFAASGSQGDFLAARAKLHEACVKYQHVSPYEFGPAETIVVRMNFNVFPADTVQINANISSGSYTLATASNVDAKGFPALDYLFYGNNTADSALVQLFTSSANRRQYVSDVIAEMSANLASVLNGWNSSYYNTFINSLGTDVSSSIGFLVNQLNFELDYLKNSKVGIPLGKKTLGIPLPDRCEAYYGAQSVEYAYETLLAIENMYLGRSVAGNDGQGFDDYLDHLGIQYGGGTLNAAIKNQFALAKSKLASIANPLSAQVVSNPAVVEAAYTELMKLLVLLKTDMPSNLGVIITYQDGDGD